MSTPNKNKCVVCGKEYDVCLSCKNVKSYRPWRTICDSIDHYKIHLVLSDHTNGFITSKEAKEQLSTINFNVDDLLPALREHIEEINRDTETISKDTETISKDTETISKDTEIKPKRGKKSVKNCE